MKSGKTYWNIRGGDKYKAFEFPGGDILRLKYTTNGNIPFMWTSEEADRDKIGLGDMIWRYGYDNAGDFTFSACHKDNKCPVFLVKDKKSVNESRWTDMQKRSSGEEIREEDKVLSDMEINSLNQFTLMYCREERAHYIQNHIVPPPPSRRKENDYEGLIKYIEDRRDENMFTNVGDYNKIIRFIKKKFI